MDMQECHKNSLLHTINGQTENINNNNRIDGDANDNNLSMRFISMVQYRKQPVLIASPLDSMFGENERHSSKVMRINSCSKSRVCWSNLQFQPNRADSFISLFSLIFI